MGAISEKGRAVLDAFHAKTGMQADGLAEEWRRMPGLERAFWLRASRLSEGYAEVVSWSALPGDVRATIKNNLYRAAKRAGQILGVSCG